MNPTARLARSITWTSSKQSYLTARLLADRGLADDCLRAYAYFRWADDQIDISLYSSEERARFIARQERLVEQFYRCEQPGDLCPQEEMLADLIAHDQRPESGLRSFITNFMAVIAFDAARVGRLVDRCELSAYTSCLATAVMDGLLYFIGNGHDYPQTPERTLAVAGAHITHLLRDMLEDIPAGLVNIPVEDIRALGIQVENPDNESLCKWVRSQVEQAREYFHAGKGYIDSLDILRARLAGAWYCARFECILDAIERDGYRLRRAYPERRCFGAWLKMVSLSFVVIAKHIAGRFRDAISPAGHPAGHPQGVRHTLLPS